MVFANSYSNNSLISIGYKFRTMSGAVTDVSVGTHDIIYIRRYDFQMRKKVDVLGMYCYFAIQLQQLT